MFPLMIRMRRDVKSRMGFCFAKGAVVPARHSPEEVLNGHVVVSEGYSVVHPLFRGGTDPHCTLFIPLKWAEVVS